MLNTENMKLKIGDYIIELHRGEETSHEEEVKKLAAYVSIICEIGNRVKEYEVNETN